MVRCRVVLDHPERKSLHGNGRVWEDFDRRADLGSRTLCAKPSRWRSGGEMNGIKLYFKILLSFCTLTMAHLISSGPTLAHHGNAAYDLANPIVLKGTVTQFVWSNPQVQIYFEVKDDKGKLVHWASETVSPGMLARAGWSKTELNPGDEITITL